MNYKLLNEIRMKYIKHACEISFHEIDFLRVMTDDYQIERMDLCEKSPDDILSKILYLNNFKMSKNIYNKYDIDFPNEFYHHTNKLFGKSYKNEYLLWSYKDSHWITEIIGIGSFYTEFYLHFIERIDQFIHKKGLLYIVDAKNFSIQNFNLNFYKFSKELNEAYPKLFKKFLILDMPIFQKKFFKLSRKFLVTNIEIVIIERDKLPNYVPLTYTIGNLVEKSDHSIQFGNQLSISDPKFDFNPYVKNVFLSKFKSINQNIKKS